MRILAGSLCGLLLAALLQGQPVSARMSCEALASLTLPNASITLAQAADAGTFAPPAPARGAAPRNAVAQALCRVAATLRPSSDSDIKIELWMPAANWNGKFQAVGNGAFNGTINYGAMTAAIGRGYATQVAAYKGSGSTNEAANFVCKTP